MDAWHGPSPSQFFRTSKALTKTTEGGDDDLQQQQPKEDMSALSRKNAIRRSVKKICVVGEELRKNQELMALLQDHFKLEVLFEADSSDPEIVYLINEFDSNEFRTLHNGANRILGPAVIRQTAAKKKEELTLPRRNRPSFGLSLENVRVCINRSCGDPEMRRLTELVHFMGGSCKNEMDSSTYLVTEKTHGKSYKLAVNDIRESRPVMLPNWITACWENRNKINFNPQSQAFLDSHRIHPFEKLYLLFEGFGPEEKLEMTEQTIKNRGTVVYSHREATHVIVDGVKERFELSNPQLYKVTKEWFWTSVDQGCRMEESRYTQFRRTISKNRKRSANNFADDDFQVKRKSCSKLCSKSSIDNLENSNASVLSGYSSEDLDKPTTSVKTIDKRHQVCLEMLETEENYLRALKMMVELFKQPLEERNLESEVLTKSEMSQIFGKIPPLILVHSNIAKNLRTLIRQNWHTENLIGKIWADYHQDLIKVYPAFINSFDTAKEMLDECDTYKPKFHNFLKATESQPACCRNTLKELLIRPVQRLPSVILLLKELLKRTKKSSQDYEYLKQAIGFVEDVLKVSNESRRMTDTHSKLLQLMNDIDGVPAEVGSSKREELGIVEVDVLGSSGGLGELKGRTLRLFAFSDYYMITKVRSGVSIESTNLNATQRSSKSLTLSRSISFVSSSKKKKRYKYWTYKLFSSIRKIERVTVRGAQGMFVITIRDNISGDDPLIIQPSGEFQVDDLEEFMKVLCKQASATSNRELNVETIDDECFYNDKTYRDSAHYQLLVKVLGHYAYHAPKPQPPVQGTLKRSITLSKLGSSLLPRSISRMSMFSSSRSTLPSIHEVSKMPPPSQTRPHAF